MPSTMPDVICNLRGSICARKRSTGIFGVCVFPKKIFSEKRLKLILKRIKLKWQIKRIETGEERQNRSLGRSHHQAPRRKQPFEVPVFPMASSPCCRSYASGRYDYQAERLYFFSLLTSRDILRISMFVFMTVI